MTNSDLATLIGSRICHDLISPIGAIGNGMELMSLTEGKTSAEMALISDSVDNANARIRYFRIAFGASSPGQLIARSEILSILTATAKGGRFTYYWHPEGDQPRHMIRCAFLMLQCIETALPLGGEINIRKTDDTWHFSAEGRRISVDVPLWQNMLNPDNTYAHKPSQVQFALLPVILAEHHLDLRLDLQDTLINTHF